MGTLQMFFGFNMIYKTILSESDFNDIMLEIYNSRDRVKKLDIPDITIQ